VLIKSGSGTGYGGAISLVVGDSANTDAESLYLIGSKQTAASRIAGTCASRAVVRVAWVETLLRVCVRVQVRWTSVAAPRRLQHRLAAASSSLVARARRPAAQCPSPAAPLPRSRGTSRWQLLWRPLQAQAAISLCPPGAHRPGHLGASTSSLERRQRLGLLEAYRSQSDRRVLAAAVMLKSLLGTRRCWARTVVVSACVVATARCKAAR
jgi:hypothetical protein